MSGTPTIDLSTDQLTFRIATNAGEVPDTLGLPQLPSWLVQGAAPLFSVCADDQVVTARTPGVTIQGVETVVRDGVRSTNLTFSDPARGLEVIHHVVVYEGSPLFETWQTVRNVGSTSVGITRLDSLALDLPSADYEVFSYTSDWGDEFEGVRTPVAQRPLLETRRGRSSKDRHPWFALFRPDGAILSASVAWSGNWVFRFDHSEDHTLRLSGGLHDWEFTHILTPGATVESPPVV